MGVQTHNPCSVMPSTHYTGTNVYVGTPAAGRSFSSFWPPNILDLEGTSLAASPAKTAKGRAPLHFCTAVQQQYICIYAYTAGSHQRIYTSRVTPNTKPNVCWG
ncbi:unnamed protein product [Ectocarpus fasciculatus]